MIVPLITSLSEDAMASVPNSRILFGTDAIASSLKLVMRGTIIIPTTKPGLIAMDLEQLN
jgi:ABC-type phosphate transport system permease subunit